MIHHGRPGPMRWMLELRSGGPLVLELRVEPEDAGLFCRVRQRGELLPRQGAGARTTVQELGLHVAHRLSRAAGRTVRCELDPAEAFAGRRAREILEDLTHVAAAELEEARREQALEDSAQARALLDVDAAAEAEVRGFLARPLDELRAALRPEAARIARQVFGGRVKLYAPLYLSDACQNDCAYCGFRRSHVRGRVHLGLEQVLAGARALADMGLRSIDLVTGEVPSGVFVDQIARHAEAILSQTAIQRIHLNLGALSVAQYRRLHDAGALGYHLYQETYDRDVYRAVHRSGPKRDIAWRLEAPERALEAGFEHVGLGVLLGLGEPARDLAALMAHARRLLAAHPRLTLGFSLPRVCPADGECDFQPPHAVDDGVLERALLLLRTAFPTAHSSLTTRERPELRDALLPSGITKLSAAARTAPGAYAGPSVGSEQFNVGDPRSLVQVMAAVRAAGLVPVC